MPWQPGDGTTSGLLYYQTMTWMINTIGFGVIQQSVYGQNSKCFQELIWYAPNALYEIGQQKRIGSSNKNKRMNNDESWRLMPPKKTNISVHFNNALKFCPPNWKKSGTCIIWKKYQKNQWQLANSNSQGTKTDRIQVCQSTTFLAGRTIMVGTQKSKYTYTCTWIYQRDRNATTCCLLSFFSLIRYIYSIYILSWDYIKEFFELLMCSKWSCFLMLLVRLVFKFPMHFAGCKSTAWYARSSSLLITIPSLFKQLKGIGHRCRIHCRISLNFFHFRGTCREKVKMSCHYWRSIFFCLSFCEYSSGMFTVMISIASHCFHAFILLSLFSLKFNFSLTKSWHLKTEYTRHFFLPPNKHLHYFAGCANTWSWLQPLFCCNYINS